MDNGVRPTMLGRSRSDAEARRQLVLEELTGMLELVVAGFGARAAPVERGGPTGQPR